MSTDTQTSCLSSPACQDTLGATLVTAQDVTLPPESLLRPPSPPTRGSGLTPRPGLGLGPSPRPSQSYIPPWARAGSPAKLSSISTTPGLIPRRVHTLCLEKKGAAGIDKFKVCPPGPLRPCAPLSSFLIISRASTAQFHLVSSRSGETLSLLHLLLSASSSHTAPGTGALSAHEELHPRRPSSFSNRQRPPAPGCCRPPPRLLRTLSTQLPQDSLPRT